MEERPGVLESLASQADVHDLDGLVHARDPRGLVGRIAEGLEVGRVDAGTDAQDEAPIAELIERAGGLHHELRAATCERHDRGDELEPLRPRRDGRQRHEGVDGHRAHR